MHFNFDLLIIVSVNLIFMLALKSLTTAMRLTKKLVVAYFAVTVIGVAAVATVVVVTTGSSVLKRCLYLVMVDVRWRIGLFHQFSTNFEFE